MENIYIMLEYCTVILQKVSFSPSLFEKELSKSIKMLPRDEIIVLKAWCILTYGEVYRNIIEDKFRKAC
jgi:hypothetical protein